MSVKETEVRNLQGIFIRDRKLLPWNEIIGFVIWQIRFKKLALMICLKLQAKFLRTAKMPQRSREGLVLAV